VKSLFRSFAGGEITEEMRGRLDLVSYQTGLSLCRNCVTLPHGPATSRAGLEFGNEAGDSTRRVALIPFIFSPTQSLMLEFGHLYMRVYSNGASVLESAVAISNVTIAAVAAFTTLAAHGYTTGQMVFLNNIVGPTALNGRMVRVVVTGTSSFTATDLAGVAISTVGQPAYVSGGTVSRVYQIATPYTEDHLRELRYAQSNDVMTITHPSYQQRELRRLGATNWTLNTLAFSPTIATPAAPTVAAGSGSGSVTYTYVTTAIADETLEESSPSPSASTTNNLATGGHFNNITPAAVAGAIRYNVYKLISGIYGYIGQTDGTVFRDDNITPDTAVTPPIPDDPFVGANNYPSAVGYAGGRRWFGGTNNVGLGLRATRSGTESNMSFSIPTQDDDRISVKVNAQKAATIQHIVPLDKLFVLTSAGEWLIDTAGSDILTNNSIFPRQQGAIGASPVTPVATNMSILYAQARGGRVRQLMYADTRAAFNTDDLCLMAPHLFDGFTIVSMGFSVAPHPTVWCVRSDGVLLGLTYVPEQKVMGWHQHTTDGAFESVAVIPEGDEDIPYAVVRRTIGARTVRYIERMVTRRSKPQAASFFVDSGLQYNGTPVTAVSGLHHLEGKTVSILADGATQPQQVVTAGRVSLQAGHPGASTITVGLPYTQRVETLPPVGEVEAYGQAGTKNIAKVWLRVVASGAMKVGTSDSALREVAIRTNEPFGAPPRLQTGVLEVTPDGDWENDTRVVVEMQDPLPMTITGIMPDTGYGG
jgi:hypothetical protein